MPTHIRKVRKPWFLLTHSIRSRVFFSFVCFFSFSSQKKKRNRHNKNKYLKKNKFISFFSVTKSKERNEPKKEKPVAEEQCFALQNQMDVGKNEVFPLSVPLLCIRTRSAVTSLPCKGCGTLVSEVVRNSTLTRLRHPLPEVEGKESSHPEQVTETQYKKSHLLHFIKGGKTESLPCKGGGTNVPEGLLTKKKTAFTLAEVLITLGIIGIVAAMTMPALMQDYKYKEFDARFKVAQNVLNNAVSWFHARDRMIYGYTYCTTQNGSNDYEKCLEHGASEVFQTFFGEAFTSLYGAEKHHSEYNHIYKNFSGATEFYAVYIDDGHMQIPNGMSILFEVNGYSDEPIIHIDINGINEKPNRFGYDIFSFMIGKNDKVCPLGSSQCGIRLNYAENTTDFTKSKYCNPSSDSNLNGLTCGYFAVNDSNYFKKIMKKQK